MEVDAGERKENHKGRRMIPYEQKRLDDFVARYAPEGRNMRMWAMSIEDFDRDQLLAVIGYLSEEVRRWQKKTQDAHDQAFRRPPRKSDMW